MQHFLYRITNKLNGRYYVGMHSTKNPDDGYLGSGKRIKAEVKKYGKENFEKVILEELPTRKALEDREREIVNDLLLEDPLCLNLKNGGEGGGKIWNEAHAEAFHKAGAIAANQIRRERLQEKRKDPLWQEKYSEAMSKGTKGKQSFLGKKHSEETKAKMRASRLRTLELKKNNGPVA